MHVYTCIYNVVRIRHLYKTGRIRHEFYDYRGRFSAAYTRIDILHYRSFYRLARTYKPFGAQFFFFFKLNTSIDCFRLKYRKSAKNKYKSTTDRICRNTRANVRISIWTQAYVRTRRCVDEASFAPFSVFCESRPTIRARKSRIRAN